MHGSKDITRGSGLADGETVMTLARSAVEIHLKSMTELQWLDVDTHELLFAAPDNLEKVLSVYKPGEQTIPLCLKAQCQ